MSVNINFYTLLLVIVCIVIIFFLIQLQSSKIKSNAKNYFMCSATSTIIWSICYSITISTDDFLIIKFFYTLEYIGTVTVIVFYFLFVLAYTKRVSIRQKPLLRLLFIPPIIFFLSVITNDINGGIFYSEIVQYIDPPYMGYYVIYGPMYYVHYMYIVILIIISVFILLQTYLSTPKTEKIFRKQLLIMIAVPVIPIIISIIRLFSLLSITRVFDLTLGFIGISYIFLYLALYKYKFLDINPIAQKYIFDGIKDGLFILDTKLRLVSLNKAAIEALEIKSENLSSLFGETFLDLIKKGHTQNFIIKDVDKFTTELEKFENIGKLPFEINIEVQKHGDSPELYYYNVLITPIKQKTNLLGYIAILRDISDSFKAQNYLNKKNNLQQLIIRMLSHDLANHIQVLNFNSELLARAKDETELKQANQHMKVKIQAINAFIKDVLNFLREEEKIYSQTLEIYDLNIIVQTVMRELEPEFELKNIEIILNKSEEPALFRANITIKSAIFNIISNAIKFSPQKGKISIHISLKRPYISLKISDQGKGIPNDLKQKVFEPFTSYGDEKGTGLGLTIVHEVVQYFHGNVWIQDNEPMGTIVCLELPIYDEKSN